MIFLEDAVREKYNCCYEWNKVVVFLMEGIPLTYVCNRSLSSSASQFISWMNTYVGIAMQCANSSIPIHISNMVIRNELHKLLQDPTWTNTSSFITAALDISTEWSEYTDLQAGYKFPHYKDLRDCLAESPKSNNLSSHAGLSKYYKYNYFHFISELPKI